MRFSNSLVRGLLIGAVVATLSLGAATASVAADSVTVNGQKRTVNGTNVVRTTDSLMRYTPSFGSSTRTNQYGFEASS